MAEPKPRIVPKAPPTPEPLPDFPYPVLEPYRHPELFAGRDRSIERATALLTDPVEKHLVLCLHAPSGTGKSSFLKAGMAPALRERGRPVYIVRRPDEPRIARRLVFGVADVKGEIDLADDPEGFLRCLRELNEAGAVPVLILDQFEEAFRRDGRAALARVGPLLVETARHPLPQEGGYRCQWVLAYRGEWHSDVCDWLRKIGLGDHFAQMPLHPLGAETRGEPVVSAAEEAFFQAISKPLAVKAEDGSPRYPWQFAGGADRELARAFARMRADEKTALSAPLVPELQIVLQRLLMSAPKASGGGVRLVRLDRDPKELFEHALRDHLADRLEWAFGRDGTLARTQAFLLLLQLVDRKDTPPKVLQGMAGRLGKAGERILTKLKSEPVRLVVSVPNENDLDEERFHDVIPHDILRDQINQLGADDAAQARCGLDGELVDLFQTVEGEARRRSGAVRTGDGAVAGAGARPIEGTLARLGEEVVSRIRERIHEMPLSDEADAWWAAFTANEKRAGLWRRRWEKARAGVLISAVLIVAVTTVLVLRRRAEKTYGPHFVAGAPYLDAKQAYEAWRGSFLGEGAAKDAFARYLVRRGAEAGARDDLAEDVLWRIRALDYEDSPANRKEIAYLGSRWRRDLITLPHAGTPAGAVLGPDGRRAVTWTDTAVYLWPLDVDRPHPITFPKEASAGVELVPDGTKVVVTSKEDLRVWLADTGRPFGPVIPAAEGKHDVSFDGTYVATCGPEGTVLRQTNSGVVTATLPGPCAGWTWSPTENVVARASRGVISIVDARDAKKHEIDTHDERATLAGFSRTGTVVVSSINWLFRFWRREDGAQTGAELSRGSQELFRSMDEDHERVLTSDGSTLRITDARTGRQESERPSACPEGVESAAFSRDGFVVGRCLSKRLFRWDPDDGSFVTSGEGAADVALAPDGTLTELVRFHGTLATARARWFAPPNEPGQETSKTSMTITRDGRHWFTSARMDDDGGEEPSYVGQFVGAADGEPIGPIFPIDPPVLLYPVLSSWEREDPWGHLSARTSFAEGGGLVATKTGKLVQLMDLRTGEEPCSNKPIELWNPVSSLALSGRGRLLATATTVSMRFWNLSTCSPINPVIDALKGAVVMEFSPDGRTLAALQKDGLRLLRVDPSGRVLGQPVHREWKRSPASGETTIFDEGGHVVRPDEDGIELLEGNLGTHLCTFELKAPVHWASTRDARLFAATGTDNALHLYRTLGCEEPGRPVQLGGSAVTAIRFDRTGHFLAVAAGASIQLFDVRNAVLVPVASRVVEGTTVLLVPDEPGQRDEESRIDSSFRALTRAPDGSAHEDTLSVTVDELPIADDPPQMLSEWTARLRVELDDSGALRPTSP